MNLYYAFGGGLGHLHRCSAVINSLGLVPEEMLIITNSLFSNLIFKKEQVIQIPDDFFNRPTELGEKILKIIDDNGIKNFYIDTFPNGMLGELNAIKFQKCKLYYVARYLKWSVYKPFISNFNQMFHRIYVLEDIEPEHHFFITKHTRIIKPLGLIYPEQPANESFSKIIGDIEQPLWLIVHSGPKSELQALFNYAVDVAEITGERPYYLIVTQVIESVLANENGQQINYFPASHFYPYCQKIFTACGFNAMRETKQLIDKHHFIPFERKFDNQFLRATKRREEHGVKDLFD